MTDLVRQEIAATADTWVVKVGTRVLTREDGALDEERIAALAEEIARVLERGKRLVLVSSGAVGAGLGQLKLSARPTDVSHLQAVAAVGQSYLVRAYDRSLKKFGRHAAQILLTADDLKQRKRYLNVRNTLLALFEYDTVPIINENDTVAVEELQTTFGDNDHLAALVTNLFRSCLLVILSDVDGLYDRDPHDPQARPIPIVTKMDESLLTLVKDKATGLSKGGMASKLEAARLATTAGENVIIASGHRRGVLSEILDGKVVGTLFLARGSSVAARKRWIGLNVKPRGSLVLDAGAETAVTQHGRSLLPIGVQEVRGDFDKGDVVSLIGPGGKEFARGLINYPASEARLVVGLRSDQIAGAIGHCPYEEIIHRDHLFVLDAE